MDQIDAARISANRTYQRRRARTAADVLLEVDPDLWDEHTRRVVFETLPMLARPATVQTRAAAARAAAAAAKPEQYVAHATGCPDCWQDFGQRHLEHCSTALERGRVAAAVRSSARPTCLSGHQHTDIGAARTCEALRPPGGYSHEHDNGDYRA